MTSKASRFLAALPYLFLLACSHDMGLMRLEERLTAYSSAVRWGHFEQAADFLTESARQASHTEIAKDIHVTGYDTVYRHESDDGKLLKMTAEITYYRELVGIVRKIEDRQTWTFDEKKGQWFRDTPLPDLSK